MPPYTPDELSEVIAELRWREQAATPGPWYAHNPDDAYCANVFCVTTSRVEPDTETEGGDVSEIVCGTLVQSCIPIAHESKRWEEDAELIAASRTHLPRLLATLEAQAAEIESLKIKHGNQCTRAAYCENEAERAMAHLTRWHATVTEIRDTARRGGSVRSFIRANLCDEILKIMGEEA